MLVMAFSVVCRADFGAEDNARGVFSICLQPKHCSRRIRFDLERPGQAALDRAAVERVATEPTQLQQKTH